MNNTDSFAAFRAELFGLIEKSEHIVITAHLSPDDDSIGSVMALHEILTTRFPDKDMRIVYEGEPSERHAVFAHYTHITFVSNIGLELTDTDLLIVVDVNNYNRVSKNPDPLRAVRAKVIIDHHASAPDEATLSYIDKGFSSNAELIYRMFEHEIHLSTSLASSVLLGILGDTGGLAYVTPRTAVTFDLTKVLIETIGTSISEFRSRYSGIPKQIIPLLQQLTKNTAYISVDGWPDMQYTYIEHAEGYSDEDMSSASHIYMGQYLPRIEGYTWGLVATPRADGAIRVSGRSLGASVNVRDLFERMQVGGGHDRAAGAKITAPTAERAIQEVVVWMKHNKPLIG